MVPRDCKKLNCCVFHFFRYRYWLLWRASWQAKQSLCPCAHRHWLLKRLCWMSRIWNGWGEKISGYCNEISVLVVVVGVLRLRDVYHRHTNQAAHTTTNHRTLRIHVQTVSCRVFGQNWLGWFWAVCLKDTLFWYILHTDTSQRVFRNIFPRDASTDGK